MITALRIHLLQQNNLEHQGLTTTSDQLNHGIALSGSNVNEPGRFEKGCRGKSPFPTESFSPLVAPTISPVPPPRHTMCRGYPQNFHHGLSLDVGAVIRAVCIMIRRNSSFAWWANANSAFRTSTRSSCSASWAVPFRPGAASSPLTTLINHLLPILCPVSNPLVNRRLTVFWDTFKAIAASAIESSITSTVTHLGKQSGRAG